MRCFLSGVRQSTRASLPLRLFPMLLLPRCAEESCSPRQDSMPGLSQKNCVVLVYVLFSPPPPFSPFPPIQTCLTLLRRVVPTAASPRLAVGNEFESPFSWLGRGAQLCTNAYLPQVFLCYLPGVFGVFFDRGVSPSSFGPFSRHSAPCLWSICCHCSVVENDVYASLHLFLFSYFPQSPRFFLRYSFLS